MKFGTSIIKFLAVCSVASVLISCKTGEKTEEKAATSYTLSHDKLKDKIMGGWAGQTIGVVYGAPVEFKYQGSIIDEYQVIPWHDHYVKYWWDKKPGLFDDIYTDQIGRASCRVRV